jgi:hypothetical protein
MSNILNAQWNSLSARFAPGMKRSAIKPVNTLSATQGTGVMSNIGSSSPLPNVWVENGVIWNVASNLAMGFTSYSSLTSFISAAKSGCPGVGLQPAPKKFYAGAFSATDMPMLLQQSSVLINNFLLLWPSLVAMSFAASFLSQLPITIYGNAYSGSAALDPSTAQSFQALSPEGKKTFKAKYVLFSPHGASPDPGITVSAKTAAVYDLVEFGWWYK